MDQIKKRTINNAKPIGDRRHELNHRNVAKQTVSTKKVSPSKKPVKSDIPSSSADFTDDLLRSLGSSLVEDESSDLNLHENTGSVGGEISIFPSEPIYDEDLPTSGHYKYLYNNNLPQISSSGGFYGGLLQSLDSNAQNLKMLMERNSRRLEVVASQHHHSTSDSEILNLLSPPWKNESAFSSIAEEDQESLNLVDHHRAPLLGYSSRSNLNSKPCFRSKSPPEFKFPTLLSNQANFECKPSVQQERERNGFSITFASTESKLLDSHSQMNAGRVPVSAWVSSDSLPPNQENFAVKSFENQSLNQDFIEKRNNSPVLIQKITFNREESNDRKVETPHVFAIPKSRSMNTPDYKSTQKQREVSSLSLQFEELDIEKGRSTKMSTEKISRRRDFVSTPISDKQALESSKSFRTEILHQQVIEAARATAGWLAADDSIWHQSDRFIRDCMTDFQTPEERLLKRKGITEEEWRLQKLKKVLDAINADPSLAVCRSIKRSEPMDGWTPLHAAAFKGNLIVVEALLNWEGPDGQKISTWDLDLQGRTALSLAAMQGHTLVVEHLKEKMVQQANKKSIVGDNAPVDLAGLTPLAWHIKSKVKIKGVVDQLYAVGDPSICPKTPVNIRSGCEAEGIIYGFGDIPGWRISMEDATCAHTPLPGVSNLIKKDTGLFGVFDGHGGQYTSLFVAKHLLKCLESTKSWQKALLDDGNLLDDVNLLEEALKEAFLLVDDKLEQDPKMAVTELSTSEDGKLYKALDNSGSTGIVVLVTPSHIAVANAGDSRAILVAPQKDGSVIVTPLSEDHTAQLPSERNRIEAAGGIVEERKWIEKDVERSVLRIKYSAQAKGQSVVPSRSFGDFYYKHSSINGQRLEPENQVVTANPEIRIIERKQIETASTLFGSDERKFGPEQDQYILLACDGLWDVLSCQEAGELLWCIIKELCPSKDPNGEILALACDELIKDALERQSEDNITAMIVRLKPSTMNNINKYKFSSEISDQSENSNSEDEFDTSGLLPPGFKLDMCSPGDELIRNNN